MFLLPRSMWAIIASLLLAGISITRACPSLCVCSQTQQVVCNAVELTKIPTLEISSATVDLSLAENKLKLLEKFSFNKFIKLKKLNLDKNQITEIEPNSFYGLEDLDEISLQDNPLTILTSHSFAGLTNVRSVYLRHNKITEVENDAFAHSQEIQTLSLLGNPLEIIRSNAFKDLTSVEALYLPDGIQRLDADAFYGLSNVSQLVFNKLNVSIIPKYTFRGISRVKSFIIRESVIGILDGETFFNVSDVESIAIEGCNIQKFHPGVFLGLYGVKEVSVVGNTISQFYPNALHAHTKSEITNLSVESNWVPCDCRVRWLRQNSKILPFIANKNWCYTPENYNNTRPSSVDLTNLKMCHPATFKENTAALLQPITTDLKLFALLLMSTQILRKS